MSDEFDVWNILKKRIERIEDNIDYARFDIQEQRIEGLEADNERIKAGCMASDENTGKRLTELEEQFYGKVNMFENWLLKIDKILQELFQRMADFEDLSIVGNDLLAKLDVGSARQTECEHDWLYTTANREKCSKCGLKKLTCETCGCEWEAFGDRIVYCPSCITKKMKKDSGGENEGRYDYLIKQIDSDGEKMEGRNDQMKPDCSDYDDPIPNSKPPEPIKCDECKSWALGCELDGSRRRDCSRQNYKFFRPKEDRLPGGTGTEPREDDSKEKWTHIRTCPKCGGRVEVICNNPNVVKREDLQFLFEAANTEGIFDDDFMDEFCTEKTRIKEAYGIE